MIRREASIFLVVGVTTVLIDFSVYTLLTRLVGVPVDIAKAISFLAGTVFAYFANRFWTFSAAQPSANSVVRFAVLYGSTLGANVLINKLLLQALAHLPFCTQAAFVGATGTSAVLNFIGMKWFVFSPRRPEAHS